MTRHFLNTIILIARLRFDPEIVYRMPFPGCLARLKLESVGGYFRIELHDALADSARENLQKGDLVRLEGRLLPTALGYAEFNAREITWRTLTKLEQ